MAFVFFDVKCSRSLEPVKAVALSFALAHGSLDFSACGTKTEHYIQ